MPPRSVFLSRLIGLCLLLYGLAMIVHRQTIAYAMARLSSSPTAMLGVSVHTVIAGLAMVLGHNLWAKHPAALIVTLVGWLTLIKGVILLLLPPPLMAKILQHVLNSATWLHAVTAIMLVLGAYLTYRSFRPGPAKVTAPLARTSPASARRTSSSARH